MNKKDQFEFEIDGKTYISRKMNPVLRGGVLKKIDFEQLSILSGMGETKEGDVKSQANVLHAMGAVFEVVPSIMWEFIKPEDKRHIGLYDDFLDYLCDTESQVLEFFNWCLEKVMDANNFLAKGSAEPKPKKLK